MSAKQVDMPEAPKIEFKRSEDFAEVYANNTQFFSSAWDLKITFGELDPGEGPNTVVQHTTITLPWPHAKLLLYFLSLHVAANESDFSRIILPKDVVPEFPKAVPAGVNEATWKILRKIYDQFIATNPELAK